MSSYDYIIIGAGASGLLLADALGSDPFFSDSSILLLDKSDKKSNDRTWCFWEQGEGPFDAILYQSWPKIHFAGRKLNIQPEVAPYRYKMLQGVDFYQHYLKRMTAYPNITFKQAEILEVLEQEGKMLVRAKEASFEADQVFDSRFDYQKMKQESAFPVLQQHFLGWFIKTETPVFDPETATFMDFSIAQKGNTRFMYVLPFSETEALVEYTLFSENVLEKSEYEAAIEDYITQKLQVTKYTITEVEKGNIPMSCYPFSAGNTARHLKIGIAGGWAKASTGYTFYSSVKKVKELVAFLKTGKPLNAFAKRKRFWFYDLLLLDILSKRNDLGAEIFESLFRKRKPQLIFKFLDEDTNLLEEIRIMAAPKPWPFIKALLGRVF